jgi:hypothetical protein
MPPINSSDHVHILLPSIVLSRQDGAQYLSHSAANDAFAIRVAFDDGGGEVFNLLERQVWRHWRDFWIGLDFKQDGKIRRERLVPGRPEIFGPVHENPLETDELGEPMIGHVRNAL